MANGYVLRDGRKQMTVRFDPDTFEDVSRGASKNGCTFAAQALMLIEVGLETLRLEGLEHVS